MVQAERKLQTFRALRYRNFRWFWFSASAQAMALGMQFLILGWLVLEELEGSSSQVGLVIFLYGIPNLAFAMVGGILADRVDRRRLLIITQTTVGTLALILATITVADMEKVWHVYAIAFLLGTLQALNMPSRMAIVTDLVQREDIMNAVSLNMVVMNAGRVVGPAAAGGFIELAGIGPALYINSGCYLVGVMFLLPIRGVSRPNAVGKTTILGDVLAGLRYFWSTPVVLTTIGLGFAFAFFAQPYLWVMPAFAKEVLEVGAGGAGLLAMAAGVGSLLGSLILASLGDFQHKNWLLLGAILTFVVALALFAWSPWYWMSWAILLFVGLGSMSYVSLVTVVIQLTVPREVQGRVLSLWAAGAALTFVGALPMGVVADVFTWPIAVTSGAVITLAFILWLGVWRPTLRHMKV